jgi:putative transposase
VVQEARVNGVSPRKVDRLVTQLRLSGISSSAVSRLCGDLDEQVHLFREPPLPLGGVACGGAAEAQRGGPHQ